MITIMALDQLVADGLAYIQANPFPVAVAVAAVILLPLILAALRGSGSKAAPWLDPADYKPLPLAEKTYITHNTLRLRFRLPDPKQRLGLPIGQHIAFRAVGADGKDVFRSYTPVSDDDQLGSVDFVIKIYPQGKMSQVLAALEVGQTMLMRGPKGRLTYTPNMKKHLGMLAGGTGITPMFQVLTAIVKNPADKTQVSLIFGNLTEADILLREELEALAAQRPNQIKIYHVLNNPPSNWAGGAGFITPDILKAKLPPPGPDTLILQCGPGPMIEAMKKHLEGLGYDAASQFQF